MTIVQAIQVLFGKTAPAGADLEGAYNALKGKRDDALSQADASTLDELAETFQDFVGNPAGWLKSASASDPRRSWWEKLAKALGATATSGAAPASTASPSATGSTAVPAAPAVSEPEPEQGIDPDALAGGAPAPKKRGGGNGGGGVVVRTGDDDDTEDEDGDRDEHRDRRDRRPPEPPRPLVPLFTRSARTSALSAQGQAILATGRYQRLRDQIITAFLARRTGARNSKSIDKLKASVAALCRRSDDVMLEATGSHLSMLISDLEGGVDLRRPSYFEGMYKTGNNYTD